MLSARAGENRPDSFVCRLLATVAGLHNQPLYSDLTVRTRAGSQLAAHKFVLDARGESWGVASLAAVESLDWTHLEEEVLTVILCSLLNWSAGGGQSTGLGLHRRREFDRRRGGGQVHAQPDGRRLPVRAAAAGGPV